MKLLLNFISPNQERNLRFGYLCFIIKDFLGVLLVLSILLAIIAIPLNIKNKHLENIQKTAEELSSKIAGQNVEQAAVLEKKATALEKIADKYYDWPAVIARLSSLVPDGVAISKFSADRNGFSLSGTSNTRDNFLLFQKNLNDSKIFTDLESPLENYIQENSLIFNLKGKISQ